jgi:hypothetical protein
MKHDVRALLHDRKTHILTLIRRGAATDELTEPEISLNPGDRNMNCQKPAAVGL